MMTRGFFIVSRAKPRFSGPEVLRTRDLEGSGGRNSPVFENGALSKWKIGLDLGVWGGSGSRPMGNPHVLTPGRASARRLGRRHLGVGTWGLRRRSLRKAWQSPTSSWPPFEIRGPGGVGRGLPKGGSTGFAPKQQNLIVKQQLWLCFWAPIGLGVPPPLLDGGPVRDRWAIPMFSPRDGPRLGASGDTILG